MFNMKTWMLGAAVLAGGLALGAPKAKAAEIGVYIGGPVAYAPPCPGPGYYWTAGYYDGGYWVPGRWIFRGYYEGGYWNHERWEHYYRDHDWDRDRDWHRDHDRDWDHDRGEHRGWDHDRGWDRDHDHFRR